jgi:hypothetical protein
VTFYWIFLGGILVFVWGILLLDWLGRRQHRHNQGAGAGRHE